MYGVPLHGSVILTLALCQDNVNCLLLKTLRCTNLNDIHSALDLTILSAALRCNPSQINTLRHLSRNLSSLPLLPHQDYEVSWHRLIFYYFLQVTYVY